MKKNNLEIRRLKIDDLAHVAKIEQAAYEFPWSESLFRDCLRVGYRGYGVFADTLQAYAFASLQTGELHILNICVAPEFHQHGIGTKLIAYLIEEARLTRAVKITLEVRASNIAAHKLYQKFNFKQIGVRKDYYPAINGKEDANIFEKLL